MQGCNRSGREADSQWIMERVNVKVQDVELRGHPADLVEHDEMVRDRTSYGGIKTKGLFTAGLKSSGCDRVAAGEESDVVTLPDQFLGEIGDHALSSPIQLGWAALDQRCYLSDLHGFLKAATTALLQNSAGDDSFHVEFLRRSKAALDGTPVAQRKFHEEAPPRQ